MVANEDSVILAVLQFFFFLKVFAQATDHEQRGEARNFGWLPDWDGTLAPF